MRSDEKPLQYLGERISALYLERMEALALAIKLDLSSLTDLTAWLEQEEVKKLS